MGNFYSIVSLLLDYLRGWWSNQSILSSHVTTLPCPALPCSALSLAPFHQLNHRHDLGDKGFLGNSALLKMHLTAA